MTPHYAFKFPLWSKAEEEVISEGLYSGHPQSRLTKESFIAFHEGLVTWGVFLWFCFFSPEKEKLPGAIFNMLYMARRVNVMDDIHK
ncbi:MAG: hypothetical protein ACN4GM_11125 [Gammaproteobacteria bacterium]